jgi:subtilisin family serine protease
MLLGSLFMFMTLVGSNHSEVLGKTVTDSEYVRIIFKADTTYIPNNFRLITTDQVLSDSLRSVFQEFGIKEFTPVFKNRYNANGQLKNNFRGKEKDSWFIVSANLKKPDSFVRKLNSIEGIIKAYIEKPVFLPCDTTYAFSFGTNQWFLNRNQGVNVQDAWTINRGRSDVIIAVCDGGVDYTHPNLDPGNRSRVITGYDTGNDDNDPMDDLPDVPDSYANHGTHIAGIIGANPTSTHNISGVMQNCKIMPVKDVGSGGIKYPFTDIYAWNFSSTAFPSDIADGIDYAVNHGAHIINLSIGFWFPNVPLIDVISGLNVLVSAINNAYNNNVLVVASMGNEGNNGSPIQFPARLPHVLAVGSVNSSRTKASSSSIGSHISVCAPGEAILSTVRNNTTVLKWGTSMATPVVCGVAGLIISQGKDRGFNLTNDDVRQILERTADDVGILGFDNETGHGIINAYNSLQL